MQGGDNEGKEATPHSGSECVEEPPWPNSTREHVIKTQENEIDMKEEGVTGGCVERSGNGKLRRREGIKRSLQDITPVSYEEYEESWDLEVNLSARRETETGGRAGTGTAARVTPSLGSKHPGRYSDAAAEESSAQIVGNSNHTSGTVNQLYSKPRRVQSSWSKRIFRTMITLILLLTSVWKVEGNTVEDWRESAFKIHSFDCSTPTMINKLHLPEVCFIPEKKLAEELAAMQPAWILGEEYIHELSGVVCSATISRFRGYCGAYSHWKFMDVPEIEADEPVTLEQCMSAKKGFFKTPDGK